MRLLSLLIIIISLTILPSLAETKVLRGKIKYASVHDAMAKADKRPKPEWIEGEVYTHSGMYVFGRSMKGKSKKLRNFRLPKDKISSGVFLHKTITKHWNGYVPPDKCYITCIPIQSADGKEHFKFYHADPHGPFGYLEYVDTVKPPKDLNMDGEVPDEEGHAMYKCWFGVDQSPEGADEPAQVTQEPLPATEDQSEASDTREPSSQISSDHADKLPK